MVAFRVVYRARILLQLPHRQRVMYETLSYDQDSIPIRQVWPDWPLVVWPARHFLFRFILICDQSCHTSTKTANPLSWQTSPTQYFTSPIGRSECTTREPVIWGKALAVEPKWGMHIHGSPIKCLPGLNFGPGDRNVLLKMLRTNPGR